TLFHIAGGPAIDLGAQPMEPPQEARLVFRPQHVTINAPGASQVKGHCLPGTIVHREFLGANVRYAIRTGEQEVLAETAFASALGLADTGADIEICIPPARLQLLGA
ncbi:MAG: TOBE domain-containing protein, partial [Alphaproteobacteria bacterium]|nr:TOBE domain-containing protein [Alphaproteobacteria bacterium]